MDEPLWEPAITHELDLGLLPLIGLTAHKLATDGSHLSQQITTVRELSPPLLPIRRRLRHKQRCTEAFPARVAEVAENREPVVRMRTKYWTPPVHENRVGAQFACQFPGCTRSYTTKSGLEHHVILKHTHGTYREKGWDCPHCCRSFERESAMTQHLRLHEPGASPFVCPCCQGFFPGRDTIRLHLAAAHKISAEDLPITCPHCLQQGSQNTFTSVREFVVHRLSAHVQ